jgi:hypothetical protein
LTIDIFLSGFAPKRLNKLDRLARNVAFIANLMEAGVDFVACDNPHATPLLVLIFASVAENEAKAISQCTIDALAVVRRTLAAEGSWVSRRSGNTITRLGNPNGARALAAAAKGNAAALAALKEGDAAWRARVLPIIAAIQSTGVTSLPEIARELTRRGVLTARGGRWRGETVDKLLVSATTPLTAPAI